MARNIGPKCKDCRRYGIKICSKPAGKCAFEKRKTPPGDFSPTRRRRSSEYGQQLKEKQKARAIYGILERQFRNYYRKANNMEGVTGERLLQLLESRLDNTIYRLGFSISRSHARQIVGHGHIKVNGKNTVSVEVVKKTDYNELDAVELINILLAKTLSEIGVKTLLIDADLRKPSIHYRLGVNNILGLSNLLTDPSSGYWGDMWFRENNQYFRSNTSDQLEFSSYTFPNTHSNNNYVS